MAFFGIPRLLNRASRTATGNLTGIGKFTAGASRGYRGAIYGAGVAYGAADPFLNSASALALRGLLGLGAAKVISDYSEGNFASPATQALAAATSFGMTWSSYKNFARAGTRMGAGVLRGLEKSRFATDYSELYRDAKSRNLPITDPEFAASRARLAGGRAYGNAYRIPYGGRLPGAPMGVRTGTNYNMYGEMASQLELGGRADRFLAAAGPLSVGAAAFRYANRFGGKPISWAAKETASSVGGVATGRMGYLSAGYNAITRGPGSYSGVARNWLDFFGDIGSIQHPYAPVIQGGALLGLGGAWLERRTPFSPGDAYGAPFSSGRAFAPWGWDQRSSRPAAVGGNEGGLHPDLFGMGMKGSSAVTSPDVMEGQMAVTQKMVTNRRI